MVYSMVRSLLTGVSIGYDAAARSRGNFLTRYNHRRLEALQSHLAALEERRQALDTLILTVRKALDAEQGGIPMPDHEKFECFKQTLIQENEAAYGPELRARYGGGTIDAANDLFMSRSRGAARRKAAQPGTALS